MIKRIWHFDKQDYKHIGFLLKNCIKYFFLGNFAGSKDALYWIHVHLTTDSKRVDE